MTRILIVDDEPLAQRRLKRLLTRLGIPAERIAMASGVGAALAHLADEPTDIVLLDVRMRDGTGFDVIRRLPDGIAPAVIFVTAFDDFAVPAFEIAAADYVMKPVDMERLAEALDRARDVLETRSPARRGAALARVGTAGNAVSVDGPGEPWDTEFWVRRAGGALVRIEAATIDYAVVEDDYVRIHAGERSYLIRESVRGLIGRLDPGEFVQVHRSALIRRSELAELTRSQVGGSEIRLRGGQRLPLGRVHGKAIQRTLRAAVD